MANQTIEVPSGIGITYLANDLYQKGLIRNPRLFVFMARLSGDVHLLKAGEYEIKPGMTPPDFLAHVVTGKVYQRSITFIEGWTFQQYLQALSQNPYITHQFQHLSYPAIMQKIGYPGRHPEGLFFPDTYFFTRGEADVSILKQSYDRMHKIMVNAWVSRDVDVPYKNAYEALIVASLIEKETNVADERAKIAGVILRRLQKGMLLQVDPTVLYGLGRPFGSEITKHDLASQTDYNTYRRFGLPPTPIDMPGRASIEAALHPTDGHTLYYVATGNGGHIFSDTYHEHLKAVKQYRQQSESNEDMLIGFPDAINTIQKIMNTIEHAH